MIGFRMFRFTIQISGILVPCRPPSETICFFLNLHRAYNRSIDERPDKK